MKKYTLVLAFLLVSYEGFGQTENGDELPVGTYFYSIDFEDRESETGWVYIQREL